MKKIILTLIMCMFLITLVNAETYTFSGVTNPAGATSNKATFTWNNSLSNPIIAMTYTEAKTGNYTELSTENNINWTTTTNGRLASIQYFRFYTTDTSIINITAYVKGYGAGNSPPVFNYTLSIYNNYTGLWERLANHSNNVNTAIQGSKIPNATQVYKDANNYVYLAVQGIGGAIISPRLVTTDYVSLTLNPCWTKTNNVLFIPNGCVYQLNAGGFYLI